MRVSALVVPAVRALVQDWATRTLAHSTGIEAHQLSGVDVVLREPMSLEIVGDTGHGVVAHLVDLDGVSVIDLLDGKAHS